MKYHSLKILFETKSSSIRLDTRDLGAGEILPYTYAALEQYPLKELHSFITLVEKGDWYWWKNSEFKYVNLYIDYDKEVFSFTDREGLSSSLSRLLHQEGVSL